MFVTCMPRRIDAPNSEGLMFDEWLYAAQHTSQHPPELGRPLLKDLRHMFPQYVRAWLAGEDPTEWRTTLVKARF